MPAPERSNAEVWTGGVWTGWWRPWAASVPAALIAG